MAPKNVDAAELFFRALCSIGWNLYLNLAELRHLCEGKEGFEGWPAWIDQIQDVVIKGYRPSGGPPDSWIPHIRPLVEVLTKGAACAQYPDIAAFLTRVLLDDPDPHTTDIDYQLEHFNQLGHKLAGELLRDPAWSTPEIAAIWNGIAPYRAVYKFLPGAASFYPVTDRQQNQIELKIEKRFTSFTVDFALISYLTLDFQFVHEYVSHALPIWSAVALEEVMLLSSTYDWYPRSSPPDGIRSFLANKRRVKCPTEFDDWRDRFKYFADLVGREKYCRFILTLATVPDADFSPSAKENLLLKMYDLPLQDTAQHQECVRIIQTGTPDASALEALRLHLPLPSR